MDLMPHFQVSYLVEDIPNLLPYKSEFNEFSVTSMTTSSFRSFIFFNDRGGYIGTSYCKDR